MAAGVPDELFWRSTPVELDLLLRKIREREEAVEKAAVLRAGLIAATVYNVNRKKGSRAARPSDYLRKEAVILSPEQMEREMDAWARSIPAKQKAKRKKKEGKKERRKV